MKTLIMIRHGLTQWQVIDRMRQYFRKRGMPGAGTYVRPDTVSDQETPLMHYPDPDARAIGDWLVQQPDQPDLFVVSPADRTVQTYRSIIGEHEQLVEISCIIEERVIEQGYGIVDQHGGLVDFHRKYPQEKERFEAVGRYHYEIPGGESIAQTYERAAAWYEEALEKYAGLRVHMISHHRMIMCLQQLIEGWDVDTFLRIDHDPALRPHNSRITQYSDHGAGLKLDFRNFNVNSQEE